MTSASDYATCPRCGISRTVKSVRATDLCGDCKRSEPTWPNVHMPRVRPIPRFYPDEAERVIKAIVQISNRVALAAAKRTTCCEHCGCLIFTWERCPSCALAAAERGAA